MALLEAILKGRIEALIAPGLILEYEAVLTRDEHLIVSEMTIEDVADLLDAICRMATPVRIRWQWRPQLRDANDEMVLETAINGRAHAIVTFNRADFEFAAKQFGILVLSPREAVGKAGLL